MDFLKIPNTPLNVSRIIYGCMGLGGSWDDQPLAEPARQKALTAIRSALDMGINFFDHADIYCRGKSEETFATLWQESPHLRQQVILQSKCGIRFGDDPYPGAPGRYDFSYEHIVSSVEGSLKRLNTDFLDLLLLHRPDPLVEPEEVARAFDDLFTSGKVRFFGVSNHNVAQMELLRHSLNQALVVNQVEFSLLHNQLVEEGVVFNQVTAPVTTLSAGTLEYCRLNQISIQAWSPLAGGAISGTGRPGSYAGAHASRPDILRAVQKKVAQLSKEKHCSAEEIAIAWILRHPARISPVIGSTNPERIQLASRACDLQLSREEWYALFIAGRGANMP